MKLTVIALLWAAFALNCAFAQNKSEISSVAYLMDQYCDKRSEARCKGAKTIQVVECGAPGPPGPPGPVGPEGPPGVPGANGALEPTPANVSGHSNATAGYCNFTCDAIEEMMTERFETCKSVSFDVLFVLDASGSVGAENFALVKRWINDFASSFDIGPNGIRVGVVVYSDSPNLVIKPGQYAAKSDLAEAVNAIAYTEGGTGTGKAIEFARHQGFDSGDDRAGGRIMIVMTDGQSDDTVTEGSLKAHAEGIQVYAVGVADADQQELNVIASDPDSSHVFQVVDYNSVDRIRGRLRQSICQEQQIEFRIQRAIDAILTKEDVEIVSRPKDCTQVAEENAKIWNGTGGVFDVYPGFTGRKVEVYCDLNTDDGGWIVFQRRMDGSENFLRSWADYVNGFGSRDGEFWLGLEKLYRLQRRGEYELRVDLEDWEGNKAYAQYTTFGIEDASTFYELTVDDYSGTAGDSLKYHNKMRFSAGENYVGSDCPGIHSGGWWYDACDEAQLNGLYYVGGNYTGTYDNGIEWLKWKDDGFYSMKFTEMKFRPKL